MSRHAACLVALGLAALAGEAPRALAADPQPTVATVVPNRGSTAGGTTVTVTGTNFSTGNPAAMRVKFGETFATAPVAVVSATQMTVVTPPHAAGAVSVVVVNQDALPQESAPLANGFTFRAPAYAWVPRANGSATSGNPGGFDVTVVDTANRLLAGSIDLNLGDPDLPNDDAWRPTQVIFDSTGAHAFIATAGTPGTLDSQKIYVVKTARAVGLEGGNPILSVIDTDGNPTSIALSSDGLKLYVADSGSWAASATVLPSGSFRGYDVTDRAAPVALAGTPGTLGVLPLLAYDLDSRTGWGTNSSFRGVVLSKSNRTVVANAGSHSLNVVDLGTLGTVGPSVDVGVTGGSLVQATVSVPSPFGDDFLFVQTTNFVINADLTLTRGDTEYFLYRLSTNTLTKKGVVATPMNLLLAWPHPDGQDMVTVPATAAEVATWSPATGSAPKRTTVPGPATPPSLAFNDVSGLFYARESDGGWTVLSVSPERGAAPVVEASVSDATGVNSLRVVGDGTELAGTTLSDLAVIDGVAASTTKHQVVATVALPLKPNGGALYPQPGPNAGAARTFVTPPGIADGPAVLFPLSGTAFCTEDAPPEIEFDPNTGGVLRLELEMGDQPDFILGPGARTVRQRVDASATTVTPTLATWRRVLRAAAGDVDRPFYARVNGVLFGGERIYGQVASYIICAPTPPTAVTPVDGASQGAASPPTFVFRPEGNARAWVELAGPGGFDGAGVVRFPVRDLVEPQTSAPTPGDRWRSAVRRAGGSGSTVSWRVRGRDVLGRDTFTAPRDLAVN